MFTKFTSVNLKRSSQVTGADVAVARHGVSLQADGCEQRAKSQRGYWGDFASAIPVDNPHCPPIITMEVK